MSRLICAELCCVVLFRLHVHFPCRFSLNQFVVPWNPKRIPSKSILFLGNSIFWFSFCIYWITFGLHWVCVCLLISTGEEFRVYFQLKQVYNLYTHNTLQIKQTILILV